MKSTLKSTPGVEIVYEPPVNKKQSKTDQVAVFFEPHADDADWWAGGLAALLVEQGWKVFFVCACNRPWSKEHSAESAKVLGVTRIFLDIPLAYTVPSSEFEAGIIKLVPPLLHELNPKLVFLPPAKDYHTQHVGLARALFRLFHWSAGFKLGNIEVYEYDTSECRDPVEIYIDVSSVWEKHMNSLRCYKGKERASIPDNNLMRIKTGRAMMLGTSIPGNNPVLYAEGYHLLQGNVETISSLCEIMKGKFYYRNPIGLLLM